MATTLTLFCLAIDNQKEVIGNVFNVKVQSDDDALGLGKLIKAEKANQLSHVDADQLIIWKLLKLQRIGFAIDKISAAIKAFDFSSSETVQVLHSGNELSQYWGNSPDKGYLHVVVEVPWVECGDDNQKRDMKQVRQAAEHLHRTLWSTPFNQLLAAFHVSEFNKSFNYLPANYLSKLQLNDLGFKETVLLVRQEYEDAFGLIEEMLLDRRTSHIGGIIITGQPGIGKTCFLFYLLLRRLSSGQPTAFQIRPTYYLLFKNSGVEIHSPEFSSLPDGTLALSDSNAGVEKPCNGFLYASDMQTTFVVQTTSPKADRWKDWEKYHDGFLYVMECFSWDEMHVLGILLGISVEALKNNYERWSRSTRTLIELTTEPRSLKTHETLVNEIADAFAKDFHGHTKDIDAMGACHRLVTIHPMGMSLGERGVPIGVIATEHLNNLVLDAIGGRTAEKQLEFYNLISNHKSFRGSAGFMFEMFVFAWLSSQGHPNGQELDCTPMDSDSPPLTIPVCGGWSPFPSNPKDLMNHVMPFCLKPDAKNFPTVDAIICTAKHLITVQATISATHSAKLEGFHLVYDGLSAKFRNNRTWCHVFVTDKEESAQKLRDQWEGKPIILEVPRGCGRGQNNIVVRVYSGVLNPVRNHQTQDDEQGLSMDEEAEIDGEGIDSRGPNGNVLEMNED